MDRIDTEEWKSRDVAKLLALVETERRYWQETGALRLSALPHRDWTDEATLHALVLIEHPEKGSSAVPAGIAPATQQHPVAAAAAPALPQAIPAVIWTAELPDLQFSYVSES